MSERGDSLSAILPVPYPHGAKAGIPVRQARVQIRRYYVRTKVNPYKADKLIIPCNSCIKHLMYFLKVDRFHLFCSYFEAAAGKALLSTLYTLNLNAFQFELPHTMVV